MSCGSLQIVETEPGVFIVQESGFNLFNWETVKKKNNNKAAQGKSITRY